MKYSFILPVYNCDRFLAHAVESIQSAGLTDFEILLVDDGSTDGTEETVRKIAEHVPGLRMVRQVNKGVSAARNRGILEASGDYLLFVDADDSLEAGSLAGVDELIEAERPDMLLFGMSFDYYLRGRLYRSEACGCPKSGCMCAEEWGSELEALFRANMLSPVWNKIIRRDLILAGGVRFREDMIEMEDYLFSADCLSHCDRIYLLDKTVYHYRQAEDERGTFNRLWRIGSLSRYMKPFYDSAQSLDAMPGVSGKASGIADQIYSMLFREKLRFASVRQIRIAAEDMLSGKRSEVIERSAPGLYRELKEGRCFRVWRERALRRVRHWAAVRVKYLRSMRENA